MSGQTNRPVAVVTGASRGIGAAIAGTLADRGFYVVGTATAAPGADGISEALGEGGCGKVLDLSDPESIDRFAAALKAADLTPEVLVNNAAITRDDLLLRMDDDAWCAVIDTNLTGTYRLTKALLRGMLKLRRGRIINVSSVVGAIGNAGQANYAAAKAGLVGFTKALAREVASRGITANCIAPGFIDTDMTRALAEDQRSALKAQIPLGRLGAPEDVAEVAAFLAGQGGAYVTGETVHVNGGMFMP